MAGESSDEGVYHLSLTGSGITIDKAIDSRTAGAVAHLVLGGVEVPPPPAATSQGGRPLTSPNSSEQRVSLREFLQMSALDRGIHTKILAVGRYMRDFEGQSDFTRDDVRARFRSAGEPQPANFPRDFQKALRAAWIAEDHQNRGHYYVTHAGDREIERRQA
jgi:hypothetical protein